jgi:DNA recombination protein RmuC
MNPILYLIVGVLIGLLIGWAAGRRRPLSDDRVEKELRDQLHVRESELTALRQDFNETASSRASAQTAREAAERSLAEARQSFQEAGITSTAARATLEAELNSARQKILEIGAAVATAQAELSAQEKLIASIKEAMGEQKKTHEDAAAGAATALAKSSAEQDELRAWLSGRERELAQATAELKARDQSLAEAQTAIVEVKGLREKDTAKTAVDLERAANDIRTLQAKIAQTGSEFATSQAQLQAERRALGEVRSERDSIAAERSRLQEQVIELKNRTGELDSQVKFLSERITAERQQIESIQEKFTKEFEAISNKLLVDSSNRFSQQSSDNLDKLLTPLRDNLTQFKASLDTTRSEASAQNATLKEAISRIGSEAANLAKALKGDAKILGNWGENMLDQLLDKSGLQRDVHYRRQRGARDAEGDQRFLDVVIDLPEKRHLVIDSKVSLRCFEEAMNCTEEAGRMALIDRHVEATRRHYRELAEKRYHETHGINAPDFVLMYIPIEAAYFAAIARDPTIFADALDRGVVLITNSTLLATLRTVSNVWRLADQQKNAIEIADRGGKLYDKFVGFVEDLKKVGSALSDGQQAWEAANSKLHTGPGNLVRQAEQLKTLGVKASKALPPTLVERSESRETTPRLVG